MKVHAGQPIGAQLIAGQFPYAAFDTWVQSGSASRTEVTKTVYDAADASVNIPGFTQKNLRNRVASTYIYPKTLSAGYVAATHYSYDIHGNVKTLIQENRNTGLSQTYKRVDYDYDLVSGNVNTVRYQDGKPDAFYHYYEYDADNRITNVYTSSTPSFTPDSRTAAFSDQEAKYFYYDHGPLARVETGENKVQASDYVYTIQGWIKNVNSNTLNATRDAGQDGQTNNVKLNNDYVARDAYGYSLNYFFDDYKSISGAQDFIASLTNNANVPQNNTAGSGSFAKNLYNGNINSMVTAMVDATDLTTNTPSPQLTAYKYDQLNRITGMNAYRTSNISSTNAWDDGSSYDQSYETRISYDKNGNILSMLSNGVAAQNLAMDNLSYKYENIANGYTKNTNKLRHVDDIPSTYTTDIDDQAANNYIYDEIGNLTHDEQEEIESIEWTVYGKVKKVTRKSGSEKPDLEFGYDASGNRIMKIVKQRNGGPSNQEGWIYTYYVHDASGNIMATYKKEYAVSAGNQFNESLSLQEHNIFGSSRLGIDTKQITLANAGFTNTGGNYNTDGTFASVTGYTLNTTPAEPYITHAVGYKQYELSNHLGNVLSTVNDSRKGIDDGTYDNSGVKQSTTPDGVVDYFTSNVTSVSDYYAFGMQMPGRNHNSSDYKYGFNGKMKDDELKTNGNSYDFGARLYDPRLGRWLAVDKGNKEYVSLNPYQFCMNSPVEFKDNDGKLLTDQNGNIIYTTNGEPQSSQSQFKTYTTTGINKDGQKFSSEISIVPIFQNVEIYTNCGNAVNASMLVGYEIMETKTLQDKSGKTIGEPMIEAINFEDLSPNIKSKLEKESPGYDCHGLTFTNGKLWIDNDQAQKIIEDDKNQSEGTVFDKVFVAYYSSLEINTPDIQFKSVPELAHTTKINNDGTVDSKRGNGKLVKGSTIATEKRYYQQPIFVDPGPGKSTTVVPKVTTKTFEHYNKKTDMIGSNSGSKNGITEVKKSDIKEIKKNSK